MSKFTLTSVVEKVKRALNPDALFDLGRTLQLVVRRREIPPDLLATSLIGSLATSRIESIADLQRDYNSLTGKSVRYKPFYNQLAKPEFGTFAHEVFDSLLDHLLLTTLAPIPHSALARFSDILLQDGSSFALSDGLREQFPGRFKHSSPAAVELHTTMSVCKDQPLRVVLTPDTQGEREHLPTPETLKGKLILADRGYLDLRYCSQVAQSDGAFVIRGTNCLNPIIRTLRINGIVNTRYSGMKLNKCIHLLHGKHADIDAEWKLDGKSVILRLVLHWNPELKLHMYLVNNLRRTDFDVDAIRTLYRLRWQVELLFKEWKSYANLHCFQTENASIAEGLIWFALAAATVKRFFAQAAQLLSGVDISTRIAAMASHRELGTVFKALLSGSRLTKPVEVLLSFLADNARRAHYNRDRRSGRLQRDVQTIGS